MANKDNQSKQYRIYIKESKSWVDVNKEFYTNYYRDINAYRKRQQEHGRCVCPASKRYLCDMDCTLTAISQVSARMAKNLRIIAAHRQSEEGGTENVKNERYGYDHRRAEKCRRCY